MAFLLRATLLWLFFAAAYVALAGAVNPAELVASGICASAGTALALVLPGDNRPRFRFALPLRVIGSTVRSLITDTGVVGGALIRACLGRKVTSKFVDRRFEAGGDTAADNGRRAAVVLSVSLAPQSYVVRLDERSLVIHSWPSGPPPQPPADDVRWPI